MERHGANSAEPRRRRRPATSCEPCRARKLRCDREQPCGRCKRARGVTECFYRLDTKTKGSDSASHLRSQNDRASLSDAGGGGHALIWPAHQTRTPASNHAIPNSHNVHEGSEDLPKRVARLETLFEQYGSGDGDWRRMARTSATPSVSENLALRNEPGKVRLFGNSHWMHLAQIIPTAAGSFDSAQVEFTLNRLDADTSDLLPLFRSLRKTRIATKSRLNTTTAGLKSDIIASLPTKAVCTDLLRCYLRSLQPIYRLVETPVFLDQVDQLFAESDQRASKIEFLTLLIVLLAIGSTFHQDPLANEYRKQAAEWNQLAQSWLVGPSEKSTMSMEGFQVFCALLLSKQMTLHCPGPAWLSAGSLLTSALAMGLHRDPARFPSLSPEQCKVRRRLWATTMELTIQHHLDSGVPLLLSHTDYDTGPPIDCDDGHYKPPAEFTLDPSQYPTPNWIQMALAESAPLRLEIVRSLNGLKCEPTFEHAVILVGKIRTEARRMQDLLNKGDSGMFEFHRIFLDIFFHRYIIMLYQGFMIQARDDPKYHLPRTACVESALAIASHVSEARDGVALEECEDLFQLAYVGRGSFKGPLALHVILILGLEVSLQLEEREQFQRGDRLDETREASRRLIISRLDDICARLEEGIAFGSVNLKAYNFLAALLAQIRAVEMQSPTKPEVYKALRTALGKCENFLRQHTDATGGALSMPGASAQTHASSMEFTMDDLINWDISQLLNLPGME